MMFFQVNPELRFVFFKNDSLFVLKFLSFFSLPTKSTNRWYFSLAIVPISSVSCFYVVRTRLSVPIPLSVLFAVLAPWTMLSFHPSGQQLVPMPITVTSKCHRNANSK